MKRILSLSIVFLLISSRLFSQGKVDYDSDSKWFWGINAGVTWQTTDVKNQNGFGYGLTFGRSFNYNYGKKISFDIRARYLTGNWYGQDVDSTKIPSNYTGVLSQTGTDYKDAQGISVNNFKTNVHRLSLELVLHANSVRERTGLDPYIFGGVGFTWYQTMGDLKNSQIYGGDIYDYKNTPMNAASINNLKDGTYETALDGSNSILHNVAFMPSIGFGLGYQVSKRVSIGFEHKTTFTGRDDFDGVQAVGPFKYDIYHYTSGYIRFQIRARGYANTNQTQTTQQTTQTTLPPVQPPIVTFLNPQYPGTVVNSPNYTVVADVKYVNGWSNITFKVDGVINNNFTYNSSTHRLESNLILHDGINTFEITGTNSAGSDYKTTNVVYQRQTGVPPVVTITNPYSSPTTVTNPMYSFTSTVTHVQSQSQVTMTVNGQNYTNFTFNPTTTGLSTMLNLVVGSNVITVTGTNQYGTDSKTTTIIYQPSQVHIPTPPVVTILNPPYSPYNVTNSLFNLNSTVLHVTMQSQVSVIFNGQNISNFIFNPANQGVTASLNLVEGSNTVVVTGTNTDGTDSKTATIIYRKVQTLAPPVVTFVTPATNPYTSVNQLYNVNATVTNVNSSSGVTVTMNGMPISNFIFNPSSTMVTFTASLVEGANVVKITGTNVAGVDSKQQTIIYTKPQTLPPPVVTFVVPSVDPYTTNASTASITATVTNVPTSSGVSVKVNGISITNFNFNPSTTLLTFNTSLVEGANTVVITGTNTVGSDTKQHVIIYNKLVIPPPVVTFLNPSMAGTMVTSPTYTMVATVTNVDNISQVALKKDGQPISSSGFSFDPVSKKVSFSTVLSQGSNSFTVTGTNAGGSDTKTTDVTFRIQNPPCEVPVISIINPTQNNSSVNQPGFDFRASTLHITSATEIRFSVNGNIQAGGSFDAVNNVFSQTIVLTQGSNLLEILATNKCGSTRDARLITYTPTPCDAPTIQAQVPNQAQSQTDETTEHIIATVANVQNQNQIVLTSNNIPQSFSYDPVSHSVTATINLVDGDNSIKLAVKTDCGSADNTWTINKKPCVSPVITITSSSTLNNTTATAPPYTMTALVENVESINQITVDLNNSPIFFTFDPQSHLLSISQHLSNDFNKFIITATNGCGTVSKTQIVKFTAATTNTINPPHIILKCPAAVYEGSTTFVSGTVTDIQSADQLQIFVNGQPVNNYSSSFSQNVLNFQLQISGGTIGSSYDIVINASNASGVDTKNCGFHVEANPDNPANSVGRNNGNTPFGNGRIGGFGQGQQNNDPSNNGGTRPAGGTIFQPSSGGQTPRPSTGTTPSRPVEVRPAESPKPAGGTKGTTPSTPAAPFKRGGQ